MYDVTTYEDSQKRNRDAQTMTSSLHLNSGSGHRDALQVVPPMVRLRLCPRYISVACPGTR